MLSPCTAFRAAIIVRRVMACTEGRALNETWRRMQTSQYDLSVPPVVAICMFTATGMECRTVEATAVGRLFTAVWATTGTTRRRVMDMQLAIAELNDWNLLPPSPFTLLAALVSDDTRGCFAIASDMVEQATVVGVDATAAVFAAAAFTAATSRRGGGGRRSRSHHKAAARLALDALAALDAAPEATHAEVHETASLANAMDLMVLTNRSLALGARVEQVDSRSLAGAEDEWSPGAAYKPPTRCPSPEPLFDTPHLRPGAGPRARRKRSAPTPYPGQASETTSQSS